MAKLLQDLWKILSAFFFSPHVICILIWGLLLFFSYKEQKARHTYKPAKKVYRKQNKTLQLRVKLYHTNPRINFLYKHTHTFSEKMTKLIFSMGTKP